MDEPSATLIERAVQGDRLALGELLLAHAPRLARQIAVQLPVKYRAAMDVDDVLQEVLCEASMGIANLRETHPRAFAAWLSRLADCQARNAVARLRAQKRGAMHATSDRRTAARKLDSVLNLLEQASNTSETPSRPLKRNEAILAVRVGLASLPTVQRDAVYRHHVDGKSLDQTATEMGARQRPCGACCIGPSARSAARWAIRPAGSITSEREASDERPARCLAFSCD